MKESLFIGGKTSFIDSFPRNESFLIDLPRTSDDGKSWNYDVTVYPKNVTIYGSVTLTHTNQQNEPLAGATWKLEKKTSNGDWEQYEG